MKSVFSKLNFRRSASALAAVLLLSFGSAYAKSSPIIEIITSPADQAVTVNYVGVTETSLVFRLDYDNKSAEKFWLIVKNDAGDVVYEQSFKDAHFTRIIHIPKEEGKIHPTFVIRTSNAQIERKFEVARKLSEDYIVTKL
ncbi:MAG: hypothetical protein Q8918_07590 [Bacteroidota bacterium]|nr:hypothetical protein [Bacteroidota bacterium]MDP4212022.1 hypothetical protein [Bacteroidota bacterium]MDP4249958.1 hypothetical protein [Bacteroidota bacterium]